MSALDKETLQVAEINILIVPVIDCLECFLECEVVSILYYTFHLVGL